MNDTSCIILELEKISRFRAVDLSLVEHIEKLKKPIKQAKSKHRNFDTLCIKIAVLLWWRRGELNPCPKTIPQDFLRVQTVIYIPFPRRESSHCVGW